MDIFFQASWRRDVAEKYDHRNDQYRELGFGHFPSLRNGSLNLG
jgi:hypothetical protein